MIVSITEKEREIHTVWVCGVEHTRKIKQNTVLYVRSIDNNDLLSKQRAWAIGN